MKRLPDWKLVLIMTLVSLSASTTMADPCGMVPPIYTGDGTPIVRIGEQQTYVFFKEGVETFVIRPGFSGKVDEFGMLIPFPTPPAIRKVPDTIFPQIAAAVDPPEVVVDVRMRWRNLKKMRGAKSKVKADFSMAFQMEKEEVRVLSQEAVGMYEVAVLAAGSAAALKKWIDENGFRYPDGMDDVCNQYIDQNWCFVAVKTKVGQKSGVDPQPGQRQVDATLPSGSTFDGYVQAMGFRFVTKQLVVPMRLSAFNDGELRNIVYLLTDGPRRIRSIPEEYVVRQISGDQLYRNVTDLLPLRIIGGTEKDIQEFQRQGLEQRRNPEPKNGFAKQLFAADLLAVRSNNLSLAHEETEKELLAIGEHFGFRGPEIDKVHTKTLKAESDKVVNQTLKDLKSMTLTVVDGDFPREVLADQNLTFAQYNMPRRRNNARTYDAKLKGPSGKKEGILKIGALEPVTHTSFANNSIKLPIGFALAALGILFFRRNRNRCPQTSTTDRIETMKGTYHD